MTAAPTLCEDPCETCAKEGLPLLLTRYALMPADAGAPRLTGQLDAPELGAVPLGASAHYGLRLLRSGYLYVFDEKRNHWDEYFVTSDGHLSKLPARIRALKQRPRPATSFQCARNGAAPLAGVITIRNPKHAAAIWLAFSDVEWTDAVFAAHLSAEHRGKHMTCVTVANGKIATQPRTAPLEQLEQAVPEFALQAIPARKAFAAWCPHTFNSRQGQAASLLQAARTLRPDGGAAIVALHDPVGLATEIAALMDVRKTGFTGPESVARPRFAAGAIASLEHSIKEQAKLAEIAAGEDLAQRAEAGPAAYNPNPALWGMPGDHEAAERWRTHTPQSLQRVADAKWRAFVHDRGGKPRFDADAARTWLAHHDQALLKFDAEQIAPLARAHVAWLQHRCMVSHLSCNYDSQDAEAGVAYTATIVRLLAHTLDKQPCYELYLRWLHNGEFAAQNLVMRALGLNQDALIAQLGKAESSALDYRAFPSDAVASAVGAYLEKMPPAAQTQLTALMTGLSGPALRYWSDFNAGKVSGKAAAAMAAASGKQFVRLPLVGHRGAFVQAHVRQLYSLDPTLKANPNQLQKAMAAQIRLLEIEGVPMKGSRSQGWYVVLDKRVVKDAVAKNLSGQALADELAKAIRTPQDLHKLDMARAVKLRTAAAGGITALAGVLMVLNYTKLLDDVDQAMTHERAEARIKLMAGKVAIAGFVAEQLGSGLEKLGETRLRNMMGRAGAIVPEALKLSGRFAGFGVGVFLGLWDIAKGVDAARTGDHGMAIAYGASGLAGLGVASALMAIAMGAITLGPIGWIVLALGVLVWLGATLFIETEKDSKLQEWLLRCHFGRSADKYADSQTQVEQYKLALGQ